MLKLATVLDNPGEPFAQTRYRDPARLKEMGYNALVIYETTGLSGVDGPDALGTGEIGRWVAQQFEQVAQRITQARAAGLGVYILYDALSLARGTVQRQAAQLTCRNRPGALCPASEQAVARSMEALEKLLGHMPPIDGVVLRFGDNDAARLPYLTGNDIYSPHCARCSQMGRADRIVYLIDHVHRMVVQKRGKRLIVRAWNVKPNGMHDSVDLCRRVCERLPGLPEDDKLMLSFKFTQTDFWRYQQWNPSSLVCGRRPIIYELQCQREFEGKGGIPNWQVPLWRDGPMPQEIRSGQAAQAVGGLAQVVKDIHFAGLWAWVRGGGWGGPFVTRETWIDANVFVVPRLVDKPDSDIQTLASDWIASALGPVNPTLRQAIMDTLAASPRFILQSFYLSPYAKTKADPWHPNADWIQDDTLDAQAAWRIIQKLPEGELDTLVQEKQQAVEAVAAAQESLVAAAVDQPADKPLAESLAGSLVYAQSLFMTLRDLLAGLVAYRRWLKSRDDAQADTCRRRLTAAQNHWTQHTQRHGSLPGGATAFRDQGFWELTQKVIAELDATSPAEAE